MQTAYSFDRESLIKILKGAGIALGGALLVYLAEILPQINFGAYTLLVGAIASILINAGKEWLAGQK